MSEIHIIQNMFVKWIINVYHLITMHECVITSLVQLLIIQTRKHWRDLNTLIVHVNVPIILLQNFATKNKNLQNIDIDKDGGIIFPVDIVLNNYGSLRELYS